MNALAHFDVIKAVLDSMSEGVNVCSPNGVIVYANLRCERLFGYGSGEMEGLHLTNLYPFSEERAKSLMLDVMEHIRMAGSWSGIMPCTRRDGSQFRAFTKIRGIEIKGQTFYVTVRREAAREDDLAQKLRSSQQFMEETLNHMPAVFYAKGLQGHYLHINSSYEKLFNWSKADIIGRTDHELFPTELADVFRRNDLKAAMTKTNVMMVEKAIDFMGIERLFHSCKFPYFDDKGRVYATGGISIDITDEWRKSNEDESITTG